MSRVRFWSAYAVCLALMFGLIAPMVGAAAASATFTMTNTTVTGGKNFYATVRIPSAAPTGGKTVALEVSNSNATGPASAIIPAGKTAITVKYTSKGVDHNVRVTLTATVDGDDYDIAVTLVPAKFLSVSVPTSLISGNDGKGTVTLDGATADDLVIALAASGSQVTVPATVTVLAGKSSATFLLSSGNNANGSSTITATSGSIVKTAKTTVAPAVLYSLTIPTTLVSGNVVSGTIKLNGPTGNPLTVQLTTSKSSGVSVPATVIVPADASSVKFPLTPGSSVGSVTITATAGSVSKARPTNVIAMAITLLTVPSSINANAATTGSVTINRPAPAGGVTILLTVTGNDLLIPTSVLIPEGKNLASFSIQAGAPTVDSSRDVTAKISGTSLVVKKTILVKGGVAAIKTLSPSDAASLTLASHGQLGISVLLTGPVSGSSLSIPVTSNNPSALSVSPAVVIAGGQQTGAFLATAGEVVNPTIVTVSVAAPGGTKTLRFVVYPFIAGSVSIVGAQQIGGGVTQIHVTTTNPAPTGGAVITLKSSDPINVPVQANVTIPAGQTEASVNINTLRTDTPIDFTITATGSTGTKAKTASGQLLPVGVATVEPASFTVNSDSSDVSVPFSLTAALPSASTVLLTSSNPAALAVPSSAVVAGGSNVGSFTFSTGSVAETTVVDVTLTVQDGTSTVVHFTVLAPEPTVEPAVESTETATETPADPTATPSVEETGTPDVTSTPEA